VNPRPASILVIGPHPIIRDGIVAVLSAAVRWLDDTSFSI
jgi:hypothetical protein